MAGEDPLRLRVVGTCMSPDLGPDDLVSVTPARFYWPGDVLVFASGGRLLAHRLIGYRRGLRPLTQADAAPIPDGAADWGDVIGRVAGGTTFAARGRALWRFTRFLVARGLGRQ
jgi:phage repressor protein C with HTH and peptisase S24 domain